MRKTALSAIALGALLVAPFRLSAQQERQTRTAGPFPHYVIEDLGTLGGSYSFSYNLNNAGVVSGGSATATQNGDPSQAVVNAPQTAFLWDHGQLRNLGTLGGPDSVGAAANLFKLAVTDSETQTSAGKARTFAHSALTCSVWPHCGNRVG